MDQETRCAICGRNFLGGEQRTKIGSREICLACQDANSRTTSATQSTKPNLITPLPRRNLWTAVLIGLAVLVVSVVVAVGTLKIRPPTATPVARTPRDRIASSTDIPYSTTAPAEHKPDLFDKIVAEENRTPQGIYRNISPMVVTIATYDEKDKPIGQGSGVILSAEGTIATNRHVMEGAAKARVHLSNGSMFDAKSFLTGIGSDNQVDVAFLMVDGHDLPFAELDGGPLPRVGSKVYAIGSPEGLESTLTEGLVSAIRDIDSTTFIQTSAPISHGSSGGPLLSEDGKVIGLTTFGIKDAANLSFAIPAKAILSLMNPSIKKVFTPLANLGTPPQRAESKLDPSSTWWLHGVKAVAVGVFVAEDLKKAGVREDKIRTDVEIRLRRGGITVVDVGSHTNDYVLTVGVDGVISDSGVLGYYTEVSLSRRVIPDDNSEKKGFATVWSDYRVGIVGSANARDLEGNAVEVVDKFINAWLKENK